MLSSHPNRSGFICDKGLYTRGLSCWLLAVICSFIAVGTAQYAVAAEIDEAREQFKTGRYAECLDSSTKAIADRAFSAEWRILMVESRMALGQYDAAAKDIEAAVDDYNLSIRLLRLAHTAYLHNGQAEKAAEMLSRVYWMTTNRRIRFMSAKDMVALGEVLLLLGDEPRLVLQFYGQVMENDPNCREAYLAAGSLAMAKQDYELAADQYRKALRRWGDDPDAHYGLARAFYYSDRKAMVQSLDAALHVNPRHAPSLVLLAEHHIDCEDYGEAAKRLDRVIAVNPWHPEAWAYRALLAHLANDPNAVKSRRANALKFWPTNPAVDYIIGRKLSQKYRFAEGAAYQRAALKSAPDYTPAKIQLAEDLLRLGHEQQGWTLADEVNTKDPYNIEAYNLVNLRDTIAGFKTLQADGFVVRMKQLEASVYGDMVVDLLREAKARLCGKYGLELTQPVTVELFADQQDFAVRTFGMPGGDGFLGVCFGNVITANSPKAQNPSNWKSMLWHEFAHVVTLNLTRNKMPRWLSEGISVYEESQQDSTWGQQMNPEYRRMILEGEMTPVGNLSAAFANPSSPMALQFAYYQSSLVVEFLVERFGLSSLKAILTDLAKGEQINSAIARHAAPLEQIERGFEAFARKRAESFGPDVDWERPEAAFDSADPEAVKRWLEKHPDSFWALAMLADSLMRDKKWEQAKQPLSRLVSLCPQHVGPGNPYKLLAQVHHSLGETKQEREALGTLAAASSDAADAYRRLMEIATEQEDWPGAIENGRRYLAVYPLLGWSHSRLGRANEELGRDDEAIASYRRLLLLDPADPVDVNHRLARLLRHRDPAAAKRHILEALADAPRFRQGHQLLLDMLGDANGTSGPTTKERNRQTTAGENAK